MASKRAATSSQTTYTQKNQRFQQPCLIELLLAPFCEEGPDMLPIDLELVLDHYMLYRESCFSMNFFLSENCSKIETSGHTTIVRLAGLDPQM